MSVVYLIIYCLYCLTATSAFLLGLRIQNRVITRIIVWPKRESAAVYHHLLLQSMPILNICEWFSACKGKLHHNSHQHEATTSCTKSLIWRTTLVSSVNAISTFCYQLLQYHCHMNGWVRV